MEEPFDTWAIVEIMGRQRYAGRVTEQTLAGQSMLRIDIPKTAKQSEFTKFFSAASLHSLTPTTEEIARGVAENLNNPPINIYDLPEWMQERLRSPRQLALPNMSNSDVEQVDDFLDNDDEDGDY
jgi:hypothetical protein